MDVTAAFGRFGDIESKIDDLQVNISQSVTATMRSSVGDTSQEFVQMNAKLDGV